MTVKAEMLGVLREILGECDGLLRDRSGATRVSTSAEVVGDTVVELHTDVQVVLLGDRITAVDERALRHAADVAAFLREVADDHYKPLEERLRRATAAALTAWENELVRDVRIGLKR